MKHQTLSDVFETPRHSFRSGLNGDVCGACMLHPQDAHALDPVVLVDHFRMSQPTFAPHPHAGFSAVTNLFDGFINGDSLGHTLPIEPGALHWMQAGSGVMHEEIARTAGRVSHGLQVFVNSAVALKGSAPAMFHLRANDSAALEPTVGVRVRVVRWPITTPTSRMRCASLMKATLLGYKLARKAPAWRCSPAGRAPSPCFPKARSSAAAPLK